MSDPGGRGGGGGGGRTQLAPSLGLTWANFITTRFLLTRLYKTVTLTDDDDDCNNGQEICVMNHSSNVNSGDKNITNSDARDGRRPARKRRKWGATLRAIEVSLSPDLPNVRCDVVIDKTGFKGMP